MTLLSCINSGHHANSATVAKAMLCCQTESFYQKPTFRGEPCFGAAQGIACSSIERRLMILKVVIQLGLL